MNHINRSKKKGFSLLELLLVMGIIAGAVVLALIIYPKITGANSVKTEVGNIGLIKSGVQSLYASSSNPPGSANMNGLLIKANLIPDNMIKDATHLANTWGGDVYVGTTTIAGKTGFSIQYNKVPAAECVKLVTGASTGFDQVMVAAGFSSDAGGIMSGGGYYAVGISEDGQSRIALDVAKITQYCNADTSNNYRTAMVMFKFY